MERGRSILALACIAEGMVVLDVSVVNVALPAIRADLGFSAAGLGWVVNAYAVTFAGLLLLGGRLADVLGHRRVLVGGLALFALASLAGGLATAPATLVVARALQGVGAAVLAPASLTVLTTAFPEGPRRTRALATWTAVGVAGGAAGNLVGGALTAGLAWNWTLLVNVPVGAAAIVLALRVLRPDEARAEAVGADGADGRDIRADGADIGASRADGHARPGIGVLGAAAATVGVAALTFGVGELGERGWGVAAPPLIIGVLALAGFAVGQTRARRPLVPPRLLRLRGVTVGNVAMLLAGACLMPMWFFLALAMRDVLGYGPLAIGLGFLPHTLGTVLVAMAVAPRLMRVLPPRTLVVAGALAAAAGFAWQSRLTPDSGYVIGILGPALLIAAGGGILNTPLTTTVTAGVAHQDAGAASGLMNTAKQVGGAVGLAAVVGFAAVAADDPVAGYERAFLALAALAAGTAAVATALPARRSSEGVPS